MPKEENFLKRFIIDSINNSIYGFRQVIKKIGYLEPLDELFIKGIEDPILFNVLKKIYDLQIFNSKAIPLEGPAIIICNSQSTLDPIISSIVINHKSQRIPIQVLDTKLGTDSMLQNFFRVNQAIFVRPQEEDMEAFERCEQTLFDGKLLVMFPEGELGSGNGKLLQFKSDFLRLAISTQAPILPIAIYGTDRIYGKKASIINPQGKIRVKFGDLIPISNITQASDFKDLNFKQVDKLTRKIHRKVKKLWTDVWITEEEQKKAP
ncbi:hypothetical protein NEF87_002904 [Candidatus Lokiarchaeum ossiferum]|uniref:Phospholipid/glycerol acyltransferase domain-containing protein n=1 Tax=Candidatus Lokiarchaeum ossiferum TaxID=2951803 RepID=A0ABY6HVY0_9ARCH|nr:hypothetical protein NEF87_002904 [Candidatus Lokiarchaeum sp. B-35]